MQNLLPFAHNHATITRIVLATLRVGAQSRQQSRPQSRAGRWGFGCVIVQTEYYKEISLDILFKLQSEQSRNRLPNGLRVIVGVIVGVIVPAPAEWPTQCA